MIATLRIQLLGDFLLISGETPVTAVHLSRVQSLLAYLLLHRSVPQDRAHLAFLLWPDSSEAQAHTNLRKLLYQLRQLLPAADQFLAIDNRSLQWRPTGDAANSWSLDMQEFEQALKQAERAEQTNDLTARRQALEQALRLYRGDLLPSCYDEWILPERDHWRQVFLQAAERLLGLLEEERDYDVAIRVGQQLLRHDPLHEATYRQLMRLQALRGDRIAALRVYHTCVTVLERELGAEPSKITRAAYEALVQSENTPETAPTDQQAARRTAPPLLGRKKEWRQLQELWRQAAAGQAHFALLTGEAGIGKTRLAEELEAWVRRQGLATASSRCYTALETLAYAPLTTWLRTETLQTSLSMLDAVGLTEIARLVPEVLNGHPELPAQAGLTESWQRQRFFEALVHAVTNTQQPLLLWLDDLQWCDHETLEWLQYLFRFAPKARVLLLGTVRAGETLPEHALVTFVNALQRDGLLTEIPLGPLTTLETTSLVEHIMGHQLEQVQSDKLYSETEGNPLFAVEMARTGTMDLPGRASRESGQPLLFLPSGTSTLPPTVQTVLATRLAQLTPLAREVAQVAAVIGRAFPFSVLAQACREDEDSVVKGLDELWQRRIVREGAAETYDFSHDKLREQVYSSLSAVARRLLHRRVAEAFEEVYARDLDNVSGQIAVHLERAGQAERAIPYYQRAGTNALRVYANTEAIAAFQQATQLLRAPAKGRGAGAENWLEAVTLYVALGDIYAQTGQQKQAREAYQAGGAYIPPSRADECLSEEEADRRALWRARLLRREASTWNLASDNPLDTFHVNAQQAFQEAERALEQVVKRTTLEWQREWIELQLGLLFPLRGSVEEMTALIDKVQPTVETYGTTEQKGKFFQAVLARDSKRNRYTASEESLAHRRKGLAELLPTGDKDLIGFAYFVLGNGLLFAHQLEEAETQMRTALSLAREIGNTSLLVRSLMFLSLILRSRGDLEGVRDVVVQAQAVPEARNGVIMKGQQAWLAWRAGNLAEAEAYGRAALAEGQGPPRANAFRWVGIWPLIGVALSQERFEDAISAARLLLDAGQQPPSEPLATELAEVLQVWERDRGEAIECLQNQVVPLARERCYL